MKPYNPHQKTARILKEAYKIVQSVDYRPSPRWVFYQLVQRGLLPKTKEQSDLLIGHWLSRARKRFYNGWRPDTLTDSIRVAYVRGLPEPPKEAIPDRIKDQDNYVEVWFEARAMVDQFWNITEPYFVSILPFGGCTSIPVKWETAKRLEKRYETYGKPIKILYFGDCDKYGRQIPEDAVRDIEKWCSAPFEFINCGLKLEQAKQFGIPDNPEKPGDYQWEALPDEHARKLIISNLEKYWREPNE